MLIDLFLVAVGLGLLILFWPVIGGLLTLMMGLATIGVVILGMVGVIFLIVTFGVIVILPVIVGLAMIGLIVEFLRSRS